MASLYSKPSLMPTWSGNRNQVWFCFSKYKEELIVVSVGLLADPHIPDAKIITLVWPRAVTQTDPLILGFEPKVGLRPTVLVGNLRSGIA